MSNLIGIIGAMDIEVNGIVSEMTNVTEKTISGIKYYKGTLNNKNVVVSKCGIGKVFAAICTQTMILEFLPSVIINTGVAGSLSKDLNVLDIAIASHVVQHDMDTSAIGDPKGLISGINMVYLEANKEVVGVLEKSAKMSGCNTQIGIIASGDKFISLKNDKNTIKAEFDALACEMDGAAVGHVCFVNNVPFGVIRAISDGEGAEMDYMTFANLAAENSIKITKKFIELY